MHYRTVWIWDANWIVPRTTSGCIWSNWATSMLMFLSVVQPDLHGLHNAAFWCQACQIRMVLIMLFGIYFIKHFFILSQLLQAPSTVAYIIPIWTRHNKFRGRPSLMNFPYGEMYSTNFRLQQSHPVLTSPVSDEFSVRRDVFDNLQRAMNSVAWSRPVIWLIITSRRLPCESMQIYRWHSLLLFASFFESKFLRRKNLNWVKD